ncbi:hypothetical protein GCM10010082_11540 [Kushneria pakistanensis]|uniref:Uncharacterized protein n=1 Tax=Kushneria pakistanensis TaxID=1508770 RepID=A0ABQ3FF42_9GAMM|nr:hypothetical protein [Kushneria pakistanensis]GHC21520.1 hypothetical protein GCM10010082_11540 [Kushneria pakistanensis]
MRRTLLLSALLPLLLPGMPVHAQQALETDSEYLQHRAASLNERIDVAAKEHSLSRKQADELHLSVEQVQTLAGNLQARNGTISRQDADEMNQRLTDVERTLTHQP